MKFVFLLAIIGFVAVSGAPTKEELLKTANELEAKLEIHIEKVRKTHPLEARLLEVEERELKLIAGELQTVKLPQIVTALEVRLGALERRVQETLRRVEGQTGTPAPTTQANTRPTPTIPTVTQSSIASTSKSTFTSSKLKSTQSDRTSYNSEGTTLTSSTKSKNSLKCLQIDEILLKASVVQEHAKKFIQILTDSHRIFEATHLMDKKTHLEKISQNITVYYNQIIRMKDDLNNVITKINNDIKQEN